MKSKSVKKIVFGFVIGAILVVSLIGCKDTEETTPEASSSEVFSEVDSEVISEEVSEDVSEEVVSEEVEEEESEMPEIVDGVQMVYYDTYEEFIPFFDAVDESVVAIYHFGYPEKGQAVLYDGAHYVVEENFSITVRSSKVIKNVTSTTGCVQITNYEYEGNQEWPISIYTTGTDIEVPLTVIYEDGTEETFIVYITKDWKYPWEE